jgi:hypothetical protein
MLYGIADQFGVGRNLQFVHDLVLVKCHGSFGDLQDGRSFYSDQTEVIRYTKEDRPATVDDKPLGQ